MIKNKDSLKVKVSNLALSTNIPNKYLIQSFMFEALLKRISVSKYKDKFIEHSVHEIKTPLAIINLNAQLRNKTFGEDKYSKKIKYDINH